VKLHRIIKYQAFFFKFILKKNHYLFLLLLQLLKLIFYLKFSKEKKRKKREHNSNIESNIIRPNINERKKTVNIKTN
jgi:hypothetical protein